MRKLIEWGNWFIWHFELMLMGIIAVISMVVAALDFFNILTDTISAPLILVMLSSIAVYLVIERRRHLEAGQKQLADQLLAVQEALSGGFAGVQQNQEDSVERVLEALDGVNIRRFENEFACIEYASGRLRQAKKWVDDTSWATESRLEANLDRNMDVSKQYRSSIGESVLMNKDLVYREIYVFHTRGRIEKLRLRERENQPNYFCKYYPTPPNVPLLQFMVIDGEEVILMTDKYPVYLAVKNRALADLLHLYFEDHWKEAREIKTGRSFAPGVVDEVVGKA